MGEVVAMYAAADAPEDTQDTGEDHDGGLHRGPVVDQAPGSHHR
jgi:hypothetical protein